MVRPPDSMPLEDRFWSRVDASGDCWVWTGKVNPVTGYGAFSLGERGRTTGAHRYSMDLTDDPPGRRHVDHQCRNHACVNPAHLRCVTPKINATENNANPALRRRGAESCVKGHSDWATKASGVRYCAECARDRAREWARENPERNRARVRAWRETHPR